MTLTPDELRALDASDDARRKEKLAEKGVSLPDSATKAEVDAALQSALTPAEYEALAANIVAGHCRALADRGVPPHLDMPKHQQMLVRTP